MANLIGQSIGRYHILEQLGEGGMAIVYKAYDTRLETDVALKMLRTESLPQNAIERALKRFEREAKALARLTHPNIVKVTDYGEYDGKPYLVMPFLDGGTLKQRLGQPVPWQEAIQLLLPIVEALDYAHSQSMIHRDVKPSNILLMEHGQPMLTDFGIAKILDAEETMDLTATSAAVGTPEYMAPEQATGKTVDHRADIYALGVVLYEMVTGKKPYIADTPLAVLFKHATDPLPSPKNFVRSLPDEVVKVLLKLLAKRPEDRYQTMEECATNLRKLLKHRTVQESVLSGQHSKTEQRKARYELTKIKLPILSIFGFLVFVSVVAALLVSNIRGGPLNKKMTPTPAVESDNIMPSASPTPSPFPQATANISPTVMPTATTPVQKYKVGHMVDTTGYGLNVDVYVADFSGEAIKVLQQMDAANGGFALSQNGQYLARSKDGLVYYINLETGEEKPLIRSVYQRDYSNLAWSPDGNYMFATVSGSHTTGNWWQGYQYHPWLKTYIISINNLALTELTNREGQHIVKGVRWLSDSKSLAYWESGDIFTINPGTGQIQNYTTSGLVNEKPFDWSPDGKWLLYTKSDSHAIYILNVETGENSMLLELDGIAGVPRSLNWSHDGEKFLYSTGSNRIYMYDFLSKEHHPLTEGSSPGWSPDGQQLLFLRNGDVYIINADGTGEAQVTDSEEFEVDPFWINTSTFFEINSGETVSETFGSEYTLCSWGAEGSAGAWAEYQCSCTESSCTCRINWYASKTKKDEPISNSTRDMSRGEVDGNVKSHNGTCQ